MGTAKDKMMDAEDKWAKKCKAENLRCSVCSSHPPLGERDVFFETSMCGRCAHNDAKDD